VYGRVAARLAGVGRIVATEHSLGDHQIEGRRLTRATRGLYLSTERLGHTTIAVSSTVARRLEAFGVPAGRITVIPNGIRATDFAFDPARRARVRAWLGIQPEEFVVGFVGRLVPGKRVDLVLRALRGLEARALIVGTGPEQAALTTLATSLGVAVTFTGESSDVAGPLGAMDLLLAPSTEETFGLAVVEAVASGLPVFYSACPALDDLPGPVPAARWLPADLESLRPAVTAAVLNGARRLPPPGVLEQYDIARVAQRVDDLYARLGFRASTLKTGARDE
jgi:glycosyltransferase involved in cell wall biosynthesis